LIAAATPARANPRPLPFTYQVETLPEGGTEVEQYVDFTPVRVLSGATGAPVWFGAVQLQTEFEHGLTPRLELGLYVTFVPRAGEAYATQPVMRQGNGLKQRLRFRLSDPETWPIDVGLYGEVTENEREIELEGKILLQRRLGDFRAIANLSVERELYFSGEGEWVLDPSFGLTFSRWPRVQPGIEGWLLAEYPDGGGDRPFNLGPHGYLGGAVLLSFGQFWWSTGVYARLNGASRRSQPGDSFGAVWGRTIVGIGF
jgi:hypothetical protein